MGPAEPAGVCLFRCWPDWRSTATRHLFLRLALPPRLPGLLPWRLRPCRSCRLPTRRPRTAPRPGVWPPRPRPHPAARRSAGRQPPARPPPHRPPGTGPATYGGGLAGSASSGTAASRPPSGYAPAGQTPNCASLSYAGTYWWFTGHRVDVAIENREEVVKLPAPCCAAPRRVAICCHEALNQADSAPSAEGSSAGRSLEFDDGPGQFGLRHGELMVAAVTPTSTVIPTCSPAVRLLDVKRSAPSDAVEGGPGAGPGSPSPERELTSG